MEVQVEIFIFLKFNLPPLHIMKKTTIPNIAKEFVETEKREYYTKSSDRKLKFFSLSSTIGNFRNEEVFLTTYLLNLM